MTRCPITYALLTAEEESRCKYSRRGLALLSPRMTALSDLPYSAEAQRLEAAARAEKMSIQGVQPKLSAALNVKEGRFDIVDTGGTYILKPPLANYRHVPENEDLTMRLAAAVGIDVPLHGLVYAQDGSLTYFVKRFDRYGRRRKRMQEDFAQLNGRTRDTKYSSSMEQVAQTIETHCTFPVLEKVKLLRLTLFCFLVGNEDMHLKNFSLQATDGTIALSPAYDLLNTTILLPRAVEELALPLNGKKRNLTRNDLLRYFAAERLALPSVAITGVVDELHAAAERWQRLIEESFLPSAAQMAYQNLVDTRRQALEG